MRGEGRIGNICVVNSITAKAESISRNIGKSSLRIAGRRELNPFVASIQFKWSVGVSGEQHHAPVVGDRRSEDLRQEWRHRVAGRPHRVPCQPDRHGVSDVAVNCIEREHTLSQVGNVRSYLELIGAVRGVVLAVATELPERRHPELANVDTIFQRCAESAVFGVADSTGYSLIADLGEGDRTARGQGGNNTVQGEGVLPEK